LVIRRTKRTEGDTVTNERAIVPTPSAGNLRRSAIEIRRNGGYLCIFR
jgi:hypothetical protein